MWYGPVKPKTDPWATMERLPSPCDPPEMENQHLGSSSPASFNPGSLLAMRHMAPMGFQHYVTHLEYCNCLLVGRKQPLWPQSACSKRMKHHSTPRILGPRDSGSRRARSQRGPNMQWFEPRAHAFSNANPVLRSVIDDEKWVIGDVHLPHSTRDRRERRRDK